MEEENKLNAAISNSDKNVDFNEKNKTLQKLKRRTIIWRILVLIQIIIFIYIIFPTINLIIHHKQNHFSYTASEVSAYNSEFTKYYGTQTGTNVKSLIDTIKQHNNVNNDVSKNISVHIGGTPRNTALTSPFPEEEITKTKNTIYSGKKYHISFGYSDDEYIVDCVIEEIISNQ